jgi:uncharacterized protein
MLCPACGHQLSAIQAGQITIDACLNGCGGMWFDHFELGKFDEPHETEGELLASIKTDTQAEINKGRRDCPKCEGIVMMRHYFSARREVEVDECPSCGGYWLDAGELEQIRAEMKDEQMRNQAVAGHLAKLGRAEQKGYNPPDVTARRLNNFFRYTSRLR